MPQWMDKRRLWLTGGLGVVVLGGYLAHAWYFRVYVNDDAYITFRYSLFLALGRGPYYNIGEHVEGYTNFLLMLLMAGVIKAAGASVVPLAAKVVGVLGGLLALVASWALCARWLRRIEAVADYAALLACAAPALVAVSAAYAVNSVSGLETTLFSGWVLLGLWLMQKSQDEGRWRGAGIALALAALTRPEGIMVFAAALLGRLLAGALRAPTERRILIVDAVIVAGTVAAHLAFRFVCYDGELLPNTYYAKVGGFNWAVDRRAYVCAFAWYHLGGLACLVAALPLLARKAEVRRAAAPALVVCVFATAALIKTGPDWMVGYRLLVPYAPIWAALSVCGVAVAADRLRRRALPLTVVVCGLLVGLVSRQGEIRQKYHEHCQAAARGYHEGHTALGRWLSRTAEPGDSVALMDIGIVGYLCPEQRVLDITGLTDRHIGKSPGEFLQKEYDPAYVLDQRPEYIVIVLTEGRRRDGLTEYAEWTPMEQRLTRQAAFRAHYYRPRTVRPLDDPLERMAAAFGAERVFQHTQPRSTYLLVVYTYQP